MNITLLQSIIWQTLCWILVPPYQTHKHSPIQQNLQHWMCEFCANFYNRSNRFIMLNPFSKPFVLQLSKRLLYWNDYKFKSMFSCLCLTSAPSIFQKNFKLKPYYQCEPEFVSLGSRIRWAWSGICLECSGIPDFLYILTLPRPYHVHKCSLDSAQRKWR